MRKILFAATALVALAVVPAAHAVVITGYSQAALGNTVTATDDGTTTTITLTNASVNLGGGILGSIPGAVMNLTATSTDAAVLNGVQISQHYTGSFCISAGANCTGNFLHGVFTDDATGQAPGTGLVLNANDPPSSLVMDSNVLSAADLAAPSAFSFGLSNLTPGLAIHTNTIQGFTASFSGTISATPTSTPEPASLALLGAGLLGLGWAKRKRG